jgi:DinB superfamily
MKTFVRTLVLWLVVPAGVVLAQNKPAQEKPAVTPENPLSTWDKIAYTRVKGILVRSAEKMPEENYSFKPVDTVRSYGQIVGHVADAQYLFCSVALGEKNPGLDIEHTKTSKADLITALNAAFAYCDKAYDTMTDASAVQVIKLFGNDAPRMSALIVTTCITWNTTATWSLICA